ncbi:hypothetical protein PSU4_61000 [Pseudonocardia sulfidoxydans NBRC 16205]|uniref:AAT family amino acid transporter n=1 Tax=Pseudonocardia sulfidoxydans NBRC 16205 TaxID=1223511 RepID=A0A511DQM4_9PSEU|nr:hypothetical protein [Pseudonocardia sulfidoxydans]GEL27146.1 hypothetical protein PSU4_61000 [Pseudonocardia sulfidoxydans NBRC 16205]
MVVESESERSSAVRRGLPWYAFGLANLAVILVLSLAFWWLLADPQWSPLGLYPQPITAALFWVILVTVFVGFNLEFAGFGRLKQPVRGVAAIAVIIVVAVLILIIFARGWGTFDPAFAAGREGGLGYQTASLFVLFGFLIFVMAVINWGHWPWSAVGLKQPWLGIAEIGVMTIPTFILFAFFALPGLASWAQPGHVIMEVNTTIGFFYSIVVSVIITGLLTENWPWRLAGPGGRTALASTIGNLVLGTVLYFILLGIAHLIMSPADIAALGSGVGVMAAEIGVCWAFWMILWANAFGNWPTKFTPVVNYVVRIVVTFVLGVLTFAVYSYWAAQNVLHEPQLVGSVYGNALGFIDWMVMFTLFYVVCLGSFGLPAMKAGAPAAAESTTEV